MTMFDFFFDPMGTQSPTLGHDPYDRTKHPVYVLRLLFVRTHTEYGIYFFEIELLLKFNNMLSLPKAKGAKNGGAAHPIYVSNPHTKLGWIQEKIA